jgi:hypothetical protein
MPFTHQPLPAERFTDDQMRDLCERSVRQFLQSQAQNQAREARQRMTQQLLDTQTQIALAHATAPWQALADQLRSELRADKTEREMFEETLLTGRSFRRVWMP